MVSRYSWMGLLVILTLIPALNSDEESRPLFLDKTLIAIPPRLAPTSAPLCGPNGDVAAVPVTDGDRHAVMINNVRGAWFDAIGRMILAPDNRTIFYTAQRGASEFLVREHLIFEAQTKEKKPALFDRIGRIVVRADGRRAAYVAFQRDMPSIVVDNVAFPLGKGWNVADLWFDETDFGVLCIAEDDRSVPHLFVNGLEDAHFAGLGADLRLSIFLSKKGSPIYVGVGREDDRGVVMIGGKPREYDGIRSIVATRDSVAFLARRESAILRCRIDLVAATLQETPIVDLPEGAFEWTADADGSNVAYVALEEGLQRVVMKGNIFNGKDRGFDLVRIETLQFNPRSKRYVYSATSGGAVYAVVDNVKSAPWENIGAIAVGDGGTVAFTAFDGERWSVVVDGKKGASYDEIERLGFAPDGKSVHYIARKEDRRVTVVGDRPTTTKGWDDAKLPVFSGDALVWAHRVREGEMHRVVFKDRSGKIRRSDPFAAVGIPAVSPDGTIVAYVAHAPDGDRLFVNGNEAARFDAICAEPAISPDGTMIAIPAVRGRELLWRAIHATAK